MASTTACGIRARPTGRMLINLILRALPFWIREPLVIAVSLFFAGLALYWFVMAGGWARGGIGLASVAVAALRIHLLRREWRSRQAARGSV
ncbi:hypothetical protein [Streptomyces olivochromogenes]|uniref:Uncharacterized protein n=1 Tax=Streptomyces olivochromogenes TaxID=1963 RepID=A0A250VTX9_STROL|nr:hypothetical protein [Streptomyces olivochromogenes]KUN37551.1 hypothetical protein AQJ27_45735 [Streptomyces olivochromogenes]GAX57657.1 hypothetical protein SO3561_09227 [Streptomyces olivochromogenes]